MQPTSSQLLLTSTLTRPLNTAILELHTALLAAGGGQTLHPTLESTAHDAAAPRIVMGLAPELRCVAGLVRRGLIEIQNTPPEVDAWELLVDGCSLYLLGSTPRGLLHAVYEFRDRVEVWRQTPHGPGAPFDLPEGTHASGRFHFARRVFHPRVLDWPGTRADIHHLSRLGATECLLCHDWNGELRHLHGYVSSEIFPDAVPREIVDSQALQLRALIDRCVDFGLDTTLWITELPCQGGPWVPERERQAFLLRYPAEVLSDSGTYQGKVLCFSHPRVQEFYRDLLARFFQKFPEVSTLYVFNVDSGGEFCDPSSCPRCHGISKIEQRDRLVRFLQEHGPQVRPGLRVLTTNWGWELTNFDELIPRQRELPVASGIFYSAQYDGWQAERQVHEPMREMVRTCHERGQLFLGFDDLHWGDDSVHLALYGDPTRRDIQDFPFGVAAKLKRWAMLGADGVVDHWGTWGEDGPINSLACRAFFLNPYAEPAEVLRPLAFRTFGDEAGGLAFAAWEKIERAHRVLSAACTWSPWQWPGWYGFAGTPATHEALLAAAPAGAPAPRDQPGVIGKLMKTALKPKPAWGFTYNAGSFEKLAGAVGEAWALAWPELAEAGGMLTSAAALAGEAPLFHAYAWTGDTSLPTRREHLRRQAIYSRSMALFGREIGLHFSLMSKWASCWDFSGAGEPGFDRARYDALSAPLFREDVRACRELADYLEALNAGRFSTGWLPAAIEKFRAKATAIEAAVQAQR